MKKLSPLLVGIVLASLSVARADQTLVDLVKKVKPSVVLIETFDKDGAPIGRGSGFFVNGKGELITNYHVVKGAYSATIKTSTGKDYPVEGIVAKDTEADIVKLVVNLPDVNIAFLNLNVNVPPEGEDIIVIGNPLGFESTVSTGIVSAVRDVPTFGKIIQITAPISSGSSGSPVINSRGEVIGIATLVVTEGQNLNFAIPSVKILTLKEMAKITAFESSDTVAIDSNHAQLFHNKDLKEIWAIEPNRVVIGAYCQQLDENVRKVLTEKSIQPPRVQGVIIIRIIEDSPAEKAGLRELDFLFKINGQSVRDMNELNMVLNKIGAGHQVLADYFRLIQPRGQQLKWKRQKTFITPVASQEIVCQPGECPLQIKDAIITHNSIDEPVLIVNLLNTGAIDIEAYYLEILCFNKFDEPVLGLNESNRISAIGQNTIQPFEKISQTITLHFRDTVGKAKIYITRIKFKNGDQWTRNHDNIFYYIVEK